MAYLVRKPGKMYLLTCETTIVSPVIRFSQQAHILKSTHLFLLVFSIQDSVYTGNWCSAAACDFNKGQLLWQFRYSLGFTVKIFSVIVHNVHFRKNGLMICCLLQDSEHPADFMWIKTLCLNLGGLLVHFHLVFHVYYLLTAQSVSVDRFICRPTVSADINYITIKQSN